MRLLMRYLLLGVMTFLSSVGAVHAGVEYHFMPGLQGQTLGCVQFSEVAPVTGASDFTVTLSGSVVGCVPSLDEESARAYLDKWGLGVRNSQAGQDTGVVGQVLLDGKNGGEYLRLEFSAPVRLTYLTFASVGLVDRFELVADGSPVDLLAAFPGTETIRSISHAQGNWPGKVDFTRGAVSLAYATVWDVLATGSTLGDGIQLENLGVKVLPEPSSMVLWCAVLVAAGAIAARHRRRVQR